MLWWCLAGSHRPAYRWWARSLQDPHRLQNFKTHSLKRRAKRTTRSATHERPLIFDHLHPTVISVIRLKFARRSRTQFTADLMKGWTYRTKRSLSLCCSLIILLFSKYIRSFRQDGKTRAMRYHVWSWFDLRLYRGYTPWLWDSSCCVHTSESTWGILIHYSVCAKSSDAPLIGFW